MRRFEQHARQVLRAPSSVGRYNSTRVDEGRKCCSLLAIKTRKMKARAEVGREEEGPLAVRFLRGTGHA